MFSDAYRQRLRQQLDETRAAGLYKQERFLTTPQNAHVSVPGREGVLNLCANNYLGLSNDPDIVAAAREALERWGYGLSSVRFICGTQQIHKELEKKLSEFLGTDDTILYSSCFDANGGLFETLLGEEDSVISDELNHARIIELLRQRSRPYLFSNSVAPAIVATSLAALDRISGLRERLVENTRYFRSAMNIPGEHPIVPIMIGDAARAVEIANRLLEQGIY